MAVAISVCVAVAISVTSRSSSSRGIVSLGTSISRSSVVMGHASIGHSGFFHIEASIIVHMMMLWRGCWEKVYDETEDPKCINECDYPFYDGGYIPFTLFIEYAESNGKRDFYNDEYKLQPERITQDTKIAEMYTKSLVLNANTDGANDISTTNRSQNPVVR